LKIILSPTKTLQFHASIKSGLLSELLFFSEAAKLMNSLHKLKVNEIMDLMGVSLKIADECNNWNKEWLQNHQDNSNLFPAISMFSGEVYRSFDYASLTPKELALANDRILILSGLYGVLRPLDLVSPYRLEMKTKYNWKKDCSSLYQYWADRPTNLLKESSIIVNLASQEYFAALDVKKIKGRIITPVFKEKQNGSLKMVMMYAKNARGKMARFLIQNELSDINDLKKYNVDGYSYDPIHSTEGEWCFVR
jgi:cytoplasmic iron level regulating protein YaaA (DUF328/UPF0246 family)